MRKKFNEKDRQFWSQALVALSQVTFGVAWALLFAPIDTGKIFLIILNLSLTAIFLGLAWWLFRNI